MRRTTAAPPAPAGSTSAVLALVRSGAARSRAEVARLTGVSAGTAAARVDELVRSGHLAEAGSAPSAGGRPGRQLVVSPDVGVVAAVALGERHALIGCVDAAGRTRTRDQVPVDVATGPVAVLDAIAEHVLARVRDEALPPLLAGAVGVPGPVNRRTGRVVSPARMPGWNGADVAELLSGRLGVPVVAENDANLMALGEAEVVDGGAEDLVFLKAGSGIGCGLVVAGALHQGADGFAGDVSHAPVPGAPAVPCSCGRTGCLDAVASAGALVASLQEAGVDVASTEGVLALARDADPRTTQALRGAGVSTGAVLATIVNVLNPRHLVVGGQLSAAEAFVAGVRSVIYAQCPPLVTDGLTISVSSAGPSAGVIGAARAALDLAFGEEGLRSSRGRARSGVDRRTP